ncbi:phospholipase A2 inhibitor and Ly6/PLAUR domain-containing protein-like [Sphaerodactylus townsendi]|uniref:phospholipase A2 inhibitor and Ly6/PLAUR domain-containing protein-like n=1 Tax=Sphaerodactylus townsendi TaxID=933632 RepID=UPI0020273EC3|nr:phospholipase A2 inhibitor and Ly6/PLAUR domain-containing protein-like [Sphaerodactylus townsendi]
MKTLLSTCLLLAFFSPVASLICMKCLGFAKGTCYPLGTETCQADEIFCLSFKMRNPTALLFEFSLKSCAPKGICKEGNFSSTTAQDKHFQSVMKCCKTHLCNKDPIELPPPNMTSNGLRCPACLSMGTSHCQAKTMAKCVGKETRCFNGSGFAKISLAGFPLFTFQQKIAFQGCVTPTSCKFEAPVTLSTSITTISIDKFKCSNATKARFHLADSTISGSRE